MLLAKWSEQYHLITPNRKAGCRLTLPSPGFHAVRMQACFWQSAWCSVPSTEEPPPRQSLGGSGPRNSLRDRRPPRVPRVRQRVGSRPTRGRSLFRRPQLAPESTECRAGTMQLREYLKRPSRQSGVKGAAPLQAVAKCSTDLRACNARLCAYSRHVMMYRSPYR